MPRFFFILFLLLAAFTTQAQTPKTEPARKDSLPESEEIKVLKTPEPLPKDAAARTVYFISGLAADERMFENLKLPPEFKIHQVAWIEPEKRENLTHYCRRMAAQIDTTKDYTLIGYSFGGLAAVEMNKFMKPGQTILISSIATKKSLSFFFRTLNVIKLHYAVPTWFYKHVHWPAYWFFNAKDKERKALLRSFQHECSNNLMKWSIRSLIGWDNTLRPENILIIDGNDDRVFPYKKADSDIMVKDGGHMMVHNKADVVSEILTARLREPYRKKAWR